MNNITFEFNKDQLVEFAIATSPIILEILQKDHEKMVKREAEMQMHTEYLKKHEAAKYLNMSLNSFNKIVREDNIPEISVLNNSKRYKKSDLDEYMMNHYE